MQTQQIDQELSQAIEEVSTQNAEIFTEDFLKKLLEEANKVEWPSFKNTQTNEFADFVAQSFISSETVVKLCETKFKSFMDDAGTTQEETKAKYLKLVAFFEYSLYLAEMSYQNNMSSLNTALNEMMSHFQTKEDPNAELN